MKSNKKIGVVILSGLALLFWGSARAEQEELQLGYVYNSWTSNSVIHGSEQRVPMSYYFSMPNLSLSLNTAFVMGDYIEDAAQGFTGSEYKSSQFSDTSLGMNWGFGLGESVKSNIVGSLNIPTGDNRWELQAENGSIPYIFEPTYYHGRDWGGSLFYTLSFSNPGLEYGIGGGYMSTGKYDITLSDVGTYSPGDAGVAMATLGFRLSPGDTWGFRFVRTFPIEATYANPSENFTQGQGSVVTTQWTSQMGSDRLVVNASYSFYNAGFTAQSSAPYSLSQDPGAYFGDHLEIHPILGYGVGKGVVMETGLLWDWFQPNGFPLNFGSGNPDILYEGGGNLLGAEQSITFQLTPGTFLSLAGLYHYVENDNAGIGNQGTITYQRITVGTNMGVKW